MPLTLCVFCAISGWNFRHVCSFAEQRHIWCTLFVWIRRIYEWSVTDYSSKPWLMVKLCLAGDWWWSVTHSCVSSDKWEDHNFRITRWKGYKLCMSLYVLAPHRSASKNFCYPWPSMPGTQFHGDCDQDFPWYHTPHIFACIIACIK